MREGFYVGERELLGSERVFKGIWSHGCGASLGRVRFFEEGMLGSKGDMLCIFQSAEGLPLPLLSPSGIIISAHAVSPALLELMTRSGIPYLILKESFPREYEGRVVLLDSERDILVVDPDLARLDDYSRSSRLAAGDRELYSDKKGYRLQRSRSGGVMVSLGGSDGDMYDLLCGVADEYCGYPITVSLSTPCAEGESESFCDRIESIFKAALYGDLSIQLEGYTGKADIERAMSCMHRAFCSLEAQGREFNGYLPRGILLSAPVWLTQTSPMVKADFVCLDLDLLISRLFGADISSVAHTAIFEEPAVGAIKRYFSSFAPFCRHLIKSERMGEGSLIDTLLNMRENGIPCIDDAFLT